MNMRIIIVFVILIIAGCSGPGKKTASEPDVYYTCSMDPQVHETKPGKCPICKMELTKVRSLTGSSTDELLLSDQQIKLGNIKVDTIRNGSLTSETYIPATINFNQAQNEVISSPIMGRIDRLYFKISGEYVQKGARVFDLYSEELNNARQEYLLLLQKKAELGTTVIDYNQLIAAAKTKLLLWGMTESQVRELERSGKAGTLTTFYAGRSGIITEIRLNEGDYVMQGGAVLNLANTSKVWVEAQVYLSELNSFAKGTQFEVSVPGLSNTFSATVEFINPEVNASSRINLVRMSVANPGNLLKPGMPAYIRTGKKSGDRLVLPSSAVIRDGRMNSVWVRSGDHRFKSRMVDLGEESGDQVQILDGLEEGEQVVISGAWLLNSEFTLRNGTNVMAGHEH